MKTRQVTLTQTGYKISGEVAVNTWDGNGGTIIMDTTIIPLNQLTKEKLLSCINDGKFGVESINSAKVDIWDVFGEEYEEYNRTIVIDSLPDYRQELFCTGI